MGNSCFTTKSYDVNHCRDVPPQNPGEPKDTYRCSCNKLVAHPLALPPQHSSTYAENLQSPSLRNGNTICSTNVKVFAFYDLEIATRYFCLDGLIGEDDFGHIYKGWLNQETLVPTEPGAPTMAVAVKELNPTSFPGHKEWLSELTYLGQLEHPNLVNFIGFYSEGEKRFFVYEFMPQGSLENHLFESALSEQPLSWELRIKVSVEAARGLSYLHSSESKVIYHDFKSSNIPLDMDYKVKLSDFGLVKVVPMDDPSQVTTQVMGTKGYTDAEYLAKGILGTKYDVHSFGIVLLELITGRRAIDNKQRPEERDLLEWVRSQMSEDKLYMIMDVKLEGRYSRKEADIVANLALDCCRPVAMFRPRMSDALCILEKLFFSIEKRQQEKSSLKSKINEDGPINGNHGCHGVD